MFNHQSGVASALVSRLDMEPAMAELVENGPASDGSAEKMGYVAIMSGLALLAIKDHENALKDPFAHVKVPCTLEGIHEGPECGTLYYPTPMICRKCSNRRDPSGMLHSAWEQVPLAGT